MLFLLFLIAACTCSAVMFICVGCSLSTFLVIFLFVVLVLGGIVPMNRLPKAPAMPLGSTCVMS